MSGDLQETFDQAERIEAQLEQVRALPRQCVTATLVLAVGGSLMVALGLLDVVGPGIVAMLAVSILAMFIGSVVAAVWSRFERRRLERLLEELIPALGGREDAKRLNDVVPHDGEASPDAPRG